MKIEPKDFKYEAWQKVAQAIVDGQGVNALLIFCEEYGEKACNYRMPVESAKTVRAKAGERLTRIVPCETK